MNGARQDAKATVLVLTDDANQRFALAEFLSAAYTVLTANDDETGFTLFSQYKRDIDALLTDLKTLKKTGLNLLTRTKQQYPALPVIVLKHLASLPLSEEVVDRKVIAYLAEPFDYAQLPKLLDAAVTQKRRFASPSDGQRLELRDLIQLYCLSEAKIALTVVRETGAGKEQGNIYFEEGRIANAIYGKTRGEEAFSAIMGWAQGKFLIRYGVASKFKEINLPWEHLLIEALRLKTEALAEKGAPESEPLLPPPATEQMPAGAPAAAPPQATLFTSQHQEAIHAILQELELQSSDLEYAVVTDPAGNPVSAVGAATPAQAAGLNVLIPKVTAFHARLMPALDFGPLAEVTILTATGLMLLYPVAQGGALSVVTLMENQGMMRWNCKEAISKIEELR